MEKTGNMWEARRCFRKMRGRYMMIDVSHGDVQEVPKTIITDADRNGSKLPKPVQDLVTLIFDVEQMKKAMLEFEVSLPNLVKGKFRGPCKFYFQYFTLNSILFRYSFIHFP